MKTKILLLLLILSPTLSIFAQNDSSQLASIDDDNKIQTIFKKSKNPTKIGYYIGPEGAYTKFDGRNVFIGGLSGGVIINHFFSAGLGAYGILNSRNLWYDNIKDKSGAYLYGGYAGVKFEFRVLPNYPVHINFPILVGGGGLVYNTWTYHNYNNYEDNTLDWDAFFVVEPGIMAELNLLKFMRLDAGVSYRYTPDLDLMNTKSSLINNFNVNLSLKFGKF